ncbi:MAG: hypothetical protein J4N69_05685 [Chloroflexi bacterium]|nr:hypothetical protein [Chloroflexota bacterium]MCI0801141.1 hypothetical protein [Chloroflexota bacterium]MCI0810326.1 hypothetical protein [Chloroflexota bacterium]MCI0863715.1 hypothetical protein [Chloroflexota bacterium]MCI0904184.1 hypothetical protein [Chloroflexota bacterium]
MVEELGRIQRPPASQYDGRRKLLLVPLVYGPQADNAEGAAVLQNYWEQMQTQVKALEAALGGLQHIYHESLTVGGDEGLQQLGAADQRSQLFITGKTESGAVLEATEDMNAMLEALDLQRCMMVPLASTSVASKLQEWLSDSNRQRYEHIANRIDSTLGENETGLLLISERHQVQFPSDIEVFYVSPPALDDYRRWLQNWMEQQQAKAEAAKEPSVDDGDDGHDGDDVAEEEEGQEEAEADAETQ